MQRSYIIVGWILGSVSGPLIWWSDSATTLLSMLLFSTQISNLKAAELKLSRDHYDENHVGVGDKCI